MGDTHYQFWKMEGLCDPHPTFFYYFPRGRNDESIPEIQLQLPFTFSYKGHIFPQPIHITKSKQVGFPNKSVLIKRLAEIAYSHSQ